MTTDTAACIIVTDDDDDAQAVIPMGYSIRTDDGDLITVADALDAALLTIWHGVRGYFDNATGTLVEV